MEPKRIEYQMRVEVEWTEAGNPVLYCVYCGITHEWTVHRDGKWLCQHAEAFDAAIGALIHEALNG